MLYFVRTTNGRYKKAHVAASDDLDEILFDGQYRTVCGMEVAPKRWGIADEIDRHTRLCERCRCRTEETR